MKILLVNKNRMIEKLFENIAKKLSLELVVQEHSNEALSSLQNGEDYFFFADDTVIDEEEYRKFEPHLETCKLSAFIHRKSVLPFGSFSHYIQKPFLPTDVLHILEKTMDTLTIPHQEAPAQEKLATDSASLDLNLDTGFDSELDQLEELEHLFDPQTSAPHTPQENPTENAHALDNSGEENLENSEPQQKQEGVSQEGDLKDFLEEPSPAPQADLTPQTEITETESESKPADLNISLEDLLPVDNSVDDEGIHGFDSKKESEPQAFFEEEPSSSPQEAEVHADTPIEEAQATSALESQHEQNPPHSEPDPQEMVLEQEGLESQEKVSEQGNAESVEVELQDIAHLEDIPEPVMASVMDKPYKDSGEQGSSEVADAIPQEAQETDTQEVTTQATPILDAPETIEPHAEEETQNQEEEKEEKELFEGAEPQEEQDHEEQATTLESEALDQDTTQTNTSLEAPQEEVSSHTATSPVQEADLDEGQDILEGLESLPEEPMQETSPQEEDASAKLESVLEDTAGENPSETEVGDESCATENLEDSKVADSHSVEEELHEDVPQPLEPQELMQEVHELPTPVDSPSKEQATESEQTSQESLPSVLPTLTLDLQTLLKDLPIDPEILKNKVLSIQIIDKPQ
ncbi:hypothetical protein [Helicobacter felis]|uniref:hypothetical protein n=1 Tax=Helicobacter felis TaxID=214 RepID=UPI000CF02F51|nr:hypothetical protein [Helicobacter felis]